MNFFLISLFLITCIPFVIVHAEPQLSYRLIPEKITVGTTGILQIYFTDVSKLTTNATNSTVPILDNIVVTSSNRSVIKIDQPNISSNGNNLVNVKFTSQYPGMSHISITSIGFSPLGFDETSYQTVNGFSKLMIKSTPDTFSYNGVTDGFVSVEIEDNNNIPVIAQNDTTVTLQSSSNSVQFTQNPIIILKGQYFATTQIHILHSQSDLTQNSLVIYAKSNGITSLPSKITVNNAAQPLTLQLYVYPTNINSYLSSNAYAIVQLHDANGIPVKASEDIRSVFTVTNTNNNLLSCSWCASQSVNSSPSTDAITPSGLVTIPKGSYWGITPLTITAKIQGVYDVTLSANNYAVSGGIQTLNIVNSTIFDDKIAKFDSVPILPTGQRELIGILHLEDSSGNPIAASKDLDTVIYSTDNNVVSVENTLIRKGLTVAPVFAKTGYNLSAKTIQFTVMTTPIQTISPTMQGIPATSLTTHISSLLDKIVNDTSFPFLIYDTSSDGSAQIMSENTQYSLIPNNSIQSESVNTVTGQHNIMFNGNALNVGTPKVTFYGDKSSSIDVSLNVVNPTNARSITLGYPNSVTDYNNILSVQLLSSDGTPSIANDDTIVHLTSDSPSILSIPDIVTIKKDTSYTIFNVKVLNSGTSGVTVYSQGQPSKTYDISAAKSISMSTHQLFNSSNSTVNTFTQSSVSQKFSFHRTSSGVVFIIGLEMGIWVAYKKGILKFKIHKT